MCIPRCPAKRGVLKSYDPLLAEEQSTLLESLAHSQINSWAAPESDKFNIIFGIVWVCYCCCFIVGSLVLVVIVAV